MTNAFALILAAAGTGSRMGTRERKTLLLLGGKPVLYHTLARFRDFPDFAQTIVVVHPDDLARYRRRMRSLLELGVTDIVPGGERRQDSVANGLAAADPALRWIAIHDAARPFVSRDTVRRTLDAARKHGAAIAGVPVTDTLKRVKASGAIVETVDRKSVWAVQTPQAFRRDLLEKAYRLAAARGLAVTDDAALLEQAGNIVRVVMGNYDNIKITTPADLVHARALLRRFPH